MKLVNLVLISCIFASPIILAQSLNLSVTKARTITDYHQRYNYLKGIDEALINNAGTQQQINYYVRLIYSCIHLGKFTEANDIITQLEASAPNLEDNPLYSELFLAKADLAYKQDDIALAIEISTHNVAKFKQWQFTEHEVDAVTRLTNALHNSGQYQRAITLLESYINDTNRSFTDSQMESFYHSYARNLEQLNFYTQALEFKLKSHDILNKMNVSDSSKAGINYSLGQSYLDLEQYEKAKPYFLKSLALDNQSGSLSNIGHSLVKLSQTEYFLKNYDSALGYATEAVEVFKRFNSKRNQAWANHSKVLNLIKLGNIDSALKIETTVLNTIKEDDAHLYVDVRNTLAQLYILHTQFDQAAIHAQYAKKLAEKKQFTHQQIEALTHLVTVAKHQKNFLLALEKQQKVTSLEKTLARQNYNQRLAELNNSITMRDRDIAIARLKLQDSEKSQAIATQQQTILYGLLVFSVLLILLIFTILRIRQRKQLIEQRRKYLDKQINQRSKLLSQVAHELSGPLTGLSLHLETLQAGLSEFNQLTYEKLNKKIADMATLVNDLNKISLLEQSGFQLNKQPLNIKQYFDTLQSDLALQLTNYNFVFTNNVDDELAINCDVTRLSQLFVNLISNTLKYSHEHGEVRLSVTQANKNSISVVYEDSSPGVDDSTLVRLFDHLYRGADLKTVEKAGSGIGLAIVKQIVDIHQWQIKASHSELGGIRYDISIA